MIVKFTSSETGSLIMMDDLARVLLLAAGKHTMAEGIFTAAEMPEAIQRLRAAVAAGAVPAEQQECEDEERVPVTFHARAWPLIEMLERTASKGEKAHVVWRAAGDF